MDKLAETKHKIFLECREILDTFYRAENMDELFRQQHLLAELSNRIGFFDILEKNLIVFEGEVSHHHIVNEEENLFFDEPASDDFLNDELQDFEVYHEESILEKADELPEISIEEHYFEEKNSENNEVEEILEKNDEEHTITESFEEELIEEATLSEENYEKQVEIKEREAEPTNPENTVEHREKKFKLAHIKGLKPNIHSLFEVENQEILSHSFESQSQILNVPQTSSNRPDFKLDLNDKIAFTQHLFGGSQTELNETISKLNSFETLDEAKEYLSDVYYDRNWKKAEDYAQRLWSLVENKFL